MAGLLMLRWILFYWNFKIPLHYKFKCFIISFLTFCTHTLFLFIIRKFHKKIFFYFFSLISRNPKIYFLNAKSPEKSKYFGLVYKKFQFSFINKKFKLLDGKISNQPFFIHKLFCTWLSSKKSHYFSLVYEKKKY